MRTWRIICGLALLAGALVAAPAGAAPAAVDWFEISSTTPLRAGQRYTLSAQVSWKPDVPYVIGVAQHSEGPESVRNSSLVVTFGGGGTHVGGSVGSVSHDLVVQRNGPSASFGLTGFGGIQGETFKLVVYLPAAAVRGLTVKSFGGVRLRVRTGSGSQLIRAGAGASAYAASATAGVSTMTARPRTGIVGGFVSAPVSGARVDARAPDGEPWSHLVGPFLRVPPPFSGPGGNWGWAYIGATLGDPYISLLSARPTGMSTNVVGAWAPIGAGWEDFRDQ